MHQGLVISAPQLASKLAMFARLYDGEAMPARERVRRRWPGPVCALGRALWALLCLSGRALLACARLLRPVTPLLHLCARPLRPLGGLLRRAALRCLIRGCFLPAGFRLTMGAWLVTHSSPASAPPAAHRRNR